MPTPRKDNAKRRLLQTTVTESLAASVNRLVADRHTTVSQLLRDLIVREVREHETEPRAPRV